MEKDDISYKLGAIETLSKTTHDNVIDLKKWIIAHEAADRVEHTSIRRKVNGMVKYATGISVVSFIIGMFWGK